MSIFKSTRARVLTSLGLATAAAVTLLPGTASAMHEGWPGAHYLMSRCAGADYCQFNPQGALQVFSGPRMYAGSATNCANAPAVKVYRIEQQSGTKNTFGVEIQAGVKLGEIFEASIKTMYQREWWFQDTYSQEYRQDVPPRTRIQHYVSKQQSRVNGQWEIHFGTRHWGHYYWYVNGNVTGQTRHQPWDDRSEQVRANC